MVEIMMLIRGHYNYTCFYFISLQVERELISDQKVKQNRSLAND